MQNEILFVVLDKYSDWEAAYLSPWIHALGKEKYTVKTVSPTREPVRSLGGFTLRPDYGIVEAPADFKGLVLIGGLSWRTEAAKQVAPLVIRALDKGKVLGAICDATVFLAAMGVLNHVRHTSNDLDDVKQWAKDAYTGEENYILQPAVRDGKIVTANGTASMEFAREVMLALEIAPADKVQAWYDFYKRGVYEAPMPTL